MSSMEAVKPEAGISAPVPQVPAVEPIEEDDEFEEFKEESWEDKDKLERGDEEWADDWDDEDADTDFDKILREELVKAAAKPQ